MTVPELARGSFEFETHGLDLLQKNKIHFKKWVWVLDRNHLSKEKKCLYEWANETSWISAFKEPVRYYHVMMI